MEQYNVNVCDQTMYIDLYLSGSYAYDVIIDNVYQINLSVGIPSYRYTGIQNSIGIHNGNVTAMYGVAFHMADANTVVISEDDASLHANISIAANNGIGISESVKAAYMKAIRLDGNVMKIRSEAGAHITRHRTLGDMDSDTLSEYDDMYVDEIDFVTI